MIDNTSALPVKKIDQYIMTSIQKNGWNINRVEKTPERCLAAVKQNGRLLQFIPKNLQSVMLCLEAVKQNASAIEFISSEILTDDFCLEATRSNGLIIAYPTYIPVEFLTKKLYLEAIKQNGKVLEYVPDKYKSEGSCMTAILQNGLALEFVPQSILSSELLLSAIKQNGLALKFVPSNRKSKELCINAVINDPLALEFVPDRFKNLELCNAAINPNWRAFLYVPESMYSLDKCLDLFALALNSFDSSSKDDHFYIKQIVKRIPDDINNDVQIIKFERQLKARYFKQKSFDGSINRFVTKEYICYKDEEVKEFETFIEFYEYVDRDLKNADLHNYDFRGISLVDLNIDGTYIGSAVLIEQNLYDDSFYAKNIRDCSGNRELMISEANEVVEAISVLHDTDLVNGNTLNDNLHMMYYISDIHLNHKLLRAFPSHATRLEVKIYIRELVKIMVNTITDKSRDDYLLIAGDISFNFEISVLFYTELVNNMKSKFWSTRQIIVVLGNHELWDFNRRGTPPTYTPTVDEIIQQYRNLFLSLDICFLQNDLLISREMIISEEDLKAISPAELKCICLKSPFVVLGGLGFSGLNSEFNASQGIYRNTIMTFDEDKGQTARFECIYDKVRKSLGDDKVVILTHMPKENWSSKDYNSKWIYVNGHTHRNDYCCSEEKTLY